MWFCYILRNIEPAYKKMTYIGSTNNPLRRIRQHNKELVGGAKYTSGKGVWEIYALLTGFPNHINTLSCEWRLKHPTGKRKRSKKYCGVDGRIKGLDLVLKSEKWTKQCIESNSESKFKLWLVKDMKYAFDKKNLLPNIDVELIDKFTKDFLTTFVPQKKKIAKAKVGKAKVGKAKVSKQTEPKYERKSISIVQLYSLLYKI
jgi:predicted GIY-YIG superfamily endonuclease